MGPAMDGREERTGSDSLDAFVTLGEDLLAAAELLRAAIYTPSPSKMNADLGHVRSLEDASNGTIAGAIEALGSGHDPGRLPAAQAVMVLRHLDDAMDALEETAGFLQAYAIQQRTDRAVRLAGFLVRAAEGLLRCARGLREGRDIGVQVRAVADAENEADELYRAALGSLMVFGEDPFHALRWKDIYDRLEEAAQFMGAIRGVGAHAREEGRP